jgi:ribosomal protein S18 acetylase RimI-like enzyme
MEIERPATVRCCGVGDVPRVLQLLEQSGLTFAPCDSVANIEAKLSVDPESVLVLDFGGSVLGCVFFLYDPMYTMVFHLTVDATIRRRGYARRLLDAVDGQIRCRGGTACVGGYIVEGNIASLSLFRERGYATFGQPITFVFR